MDVNILGKHNFKLNTRYPLHGTFQRKTTAAYCLLPNT